MAEINFWSPTNIRNYLSTLCINSQTKFDAGIYILIDGWVRVYKQGKYPNFNNCDYTELFARKGSTQQVKNERDGRGSKAPPSQTGTEKLHSDDGLIWSSESLSSRMICSSARDWEQWQKAENEKHGLRKCGGKTMFLVSLLRTERETTVLGRRFWSQRSVGPFTGPRAHLPISRPISFSRCHVFPPFSFLIYKPHLIKTYFIWVKLQIWPRYSS